MDRRRFLASTCAGAVLVAGSVLLGCQNGRQGPNPGPDPVPTTPVTISFAGLSTNMAPVTSHVESGFTVSMVAANWDSDTLFGRPAPFVFFNSPANVTTPGEIRVTAGTSLFVFTSVDLYSSTTPIPFSFSGTRGQGQSFQASDTLTSAQLGNTFGNFATVTNSNAETLIDALVIRLTNPSAPCCSNRMGLDNIVLKR
jgi:hypothetical protein